MSRRTYSSDLSGAQWGLLEPLLPPDSRRGHPRTSDLREVVNGILYVLRGGIPWRMMPHDLPPWGTVWWYFRKWRKDGTWERVEEALRPMVRESEGRDATPSGAIIDSQSVKTTGKGGLAAMTQAKRCRAQAPHRSGHHGIAPRGGGACCQYPGPGRSQAGAGQAAEPFPEAPDHLG